MAQTKESVNGYLVVSETFAVPDSEGANVETVALTALEDGKDGKLCGTKFPLHVEVTEASAGDGAWDVKVQVSPDNSNWVDADASTISDLDPTGTNNAQALCDLTDIYAPYVRLVVFTDGTDTLDAAAGLAIISIPALGVVV